MGSNADDARGVRLSYRFAVPAALGIRSEIVGSASQSQVSRCSSTLPRQACRWPALHAGWPGTGSCRRPESYLAGRPGVCLTSLTWIYLSARDDLDSDVRKSTAIGHQRRIRQMGFGWTNHRNASRIHTRLGVGVRHRHVGNRSVCCMRKYRFAVQSADLGDCR